MYIVFKKSNKDFCLAINICVFYVRYIIYFWSTGTSERDRGSGRGEEALFEMIGGKFPCYLVSVLDHPSFITYHNSGITLVRNFSFTC